MRMRTLVFTLLVGSALIVGGCPADGQVGPQGEAGDPGSEGPPGDKGDQGPTGDTGANGAPGDQGATGAQGDPGAQGPKGDTGANGADASCADAEKLTITGISGLGDMNFTGTALNITVGVEGEDGGAVTDADIVILGDDGPEFTAGATFDAFTATPEAEGQFGYLVMATDGCTVAVHAFMVEVVQFEARVSFVHLVDGAATSVVVAPTGETTGTSVAFGGRSSWLTLDSASATWDLVDSADDSVIATLAAMEFAHESEQFVVFFNDGANVGVTVVPADQLEPTADMWSVRFFNATAVPVTVFGSDDTTVVFDDVAPGSVSTETAEYPEAALTLFADVNADDESDFRVNVPSLAQYEGSTYIAFVYLAAGAPKVLFVEYQTDSGALTSYTTVTLTDLNTALLSLVHIASSADATLKLRPTGGTVLKTAGYETASAFFQVPNTGSFEVLDAADAVVATIQLALPKASRDSLVFYDDGGTLAWTTHTENDAPLVSGTSRFGFFNGADGLGSVTVASATGTALFTDVATGMRAPDQIEVATASQFLTFDTDDDGAADMAFNLAAGSSSGQLYSGESGTIFLYVDGTDVIGLYRSFTSNTTTLTSYYTTYTLAAYTPPVMPDFTYAAGTLTDPPGASLGVTFTDEVGDTHAITVTGTCTIADLTIPIDISHTYRGDIEIELTSPAGTTVVVRSSTGGSSDHLVGVFVDGAAGPNAIEPEEPLAGFAGESATGNWTIFVWDNYPDTENGTLNGWGLNLFCE